MTHELHLKYRPTSFKELVGQAKAVRVLSQFLKTDTLPHTIIFTGGSGCGKTTTARILKSKLNCSDIDCVEINAADNRGIDMAREICRRMTLAPVSGDCRIWIIDEIQQATKEFQSLMLKALEDVPRHVYFFLCTTDPQKLLPTVRTRCTEIRMESLSPDDIASLLKSIAAKEGVTIGQKLIDKIVENSNGGARQAVKLYNSVIAIDDEDRQVESVEDPEERRQAWDIVRAMLYEKPKWGTIAKLIKEVKVDNAESFRHLVLACANTELLKAGANSARAFLILDVFSRNWYDDPKSGLTRCCFEVVQGK